MPILIAVGQTVRAHVWKSFEKWTLTSRLSVSLKVVETNTDRSDNNDFLLTFHSNHGPAYLVPFSRYSETLAENCYFSELTVI